MGLFLIISFLFVMVWDTDQRICHVESSKINLTWVVSMFLDTILCQTDHITLLHLIT
jgi:hypothetical protein